MYYTLCCDCTTGSIKGIVHEMDKLVSNSKFWYGEFDYGLKLANFVDSPFKGGCLSSDKSECRQTSLTIVGQVWPPSVVLQTLGGYALMNQNTIEAP